MSKYDNNAPYIYRSAAGRVPRSSGPLPSSFARAAATRRHILAASQGGGRLRNPVRRGLSLENQPFKAKSKLAISLYFNYLCVPIGSSRFSS